ncbi:DinB family protein [Flavobacteriaceae bacterium S356]|uniref:DinB family protein n=1 Tax=Asprobacillus argus TaxID=3076534 RepID=A0ABU3LHV3_9FLAO|nr:DinB family protein [Flavobacteriaceae bacterium S356]
MKVHSSALLKELSDYVNTHLAYANSLKSVSNDLLNAKQDLNAWSALECLEHLNLCLNFYIPEIKKRLASSQKVTSDFFKTNYLGNKFALSMLPKENMKKVKTFKKVNPIHSNLNKENTIGTFIHHQQHLLQLLELSQNENLTKTKTATLLPFFKLQLGNTFRVIIYHNERHIIQAQKQIDIH